MSYRGLVSMILLPEGEQPGVTIYHAVNLGDDMDGAEKAIHIALQSAKGRYDRTVLNMDGFGQRRQFPSDDDMADWAETYADQRWEVEFEPDEEVTHIEIRGYDATDHQFFMRKVTYATKN